MKRLFSVWNGSTMAHFENKMDAKIYREEFGGFVSLGPDHDRFGVHGNPRTHSHNAKSGGAGGGFPRKFK